MNKSVVLHDPDSGAASSSGVMESSQKRKRLLIRVALAALVLALIGGGAAGTLFYQALSVRGQLQGAIDLVPQLRAELSDGDGDKAQKTLETIRSQTAAARSTTGGSLWTLGGAVPFAGVNFGAVREIAVTADELATKAAAPLLKVYSSLDLGALAPKDGRFDVTQLEESAPSILTAADTVRLSHQRMALIDASKLMPQLAAPVGSAIEELGDLDDAMVTVSSAAKLLPAMLGSSEPRSYLVLVQNSSESRATGGIPGALAVLHTNDGHVTLGKQSSAVELGSFYPSIEVDPEQSTLYSARLGTQMQNVNLTPDFPTAAMTAKKMWEKRNPSDEIDGVFALDPVMLSHLLGATGAIDLADPQILDLIDGTDLPVSLTKANVVTTLLSDVYREIEEPAAQDAYFAAVASKTFTAFTEGHGSSTELMHALAVGAEEGRLNLWSARREEQETLASTAISGSIVGNRGGGATFGVYFNDGTGAKMDFYARRTVQLIQSCKSEGYRRDTVRITAENGAPADAATSLPAYVTGGGTYGVKPGRIRTNYVVYGPSQAFVETATINGVAAPVSSGKHGQRPVGTVSLELGPGETATIDVVFSKVVQDSEPQVRVTPTIQPLTEVIRPVERGTCG
ncbi:DUF4012 domain-containing protein [Arthrobacter sp. 08Y14]|uniref:DUF4012 domain-containing protein n=1 Tax=Arthrobacter sp. 08Y14 TaxID=2058885 RepID=UPI002158566D|nr:DUF4012 domain-containing protein [Arthrobacter sp. 08Y14]